MVGVVIVDLENLQKELFFEKIEKFSYQFSLDAFEIPSMDNSKEFLRYEIKILTKFFEYK